MRPLEKWIHTDNTIIPPIKEIYNPYSDAKDDLERNIGGYCSYCERPTTDEASHVEHVQPKGLLKYKNLEFSWSNFLLSCARCNGADNKHNKDVVFANIHLPHNNNTSYSIIYLEGGFVTINPILNGKELENAEALINLVGLDKRPGHASHLPKDKRWDRRREVWEIAVRYLAEYENHKIGVLNIIDLAKGYGFWSVWFNVFCNHSLIKQALIQNFRGTASCFDSNNNFNPIPRNPTNPIDTI